MTTVLQLFKDNNEKAEQSLQLVIVDKDYAEINSIRAVFGNAKVLLCKMHVLDAFRRSFKGHALTSDMRDALRDSLQSMVHSPAEADYQTAREKIDQISDSCAKYFDQHWSEPIKHMWAGYMVKELPHMGFMTNNTVES